MSRQGEAGGRTGQRNENLRLGRQATAAMARQSPHAIQRNPGLDAEARMASACPISWTSTDRKTATTHTMIGRTSRCELVLPRIKPISQNIGWTRTGIFSRRK